MKSHAYDSLLTIFFVGLLMIDLRLASTGIVEYFNYVYILFFIVYTLLRLVVLRKKKNESEERSVSSQFGDILRVIAQTIFLVLAIGDIFNG